MRRAILTLAGTAAGLAALFSFKTHAAVSDAAVTPAPGLVTASRASAAPANKPSSAPPSAQPAAPASTKARASAGTFTGADENTQYGPVQVQITSNGAKVSGVNELQQPDDSIGANAITQLDAEALASGSADIQAVSGATYTSAGYIKSLQSAIDQAGQ